MRQRVEPADFLETRGTSRNAHERGIWEVCDEYEIWGDEVVAGVEYRGHAEEWGMYSPLEDVPDLFLKFSRTFIEDDFEGAVLAFAHNYGLPNSTQEGLNGTKGAHLTPERMALPRFRSEAEKAHSVLALYEAVLNEDVQAIKSAFLDHRGIDLFALYDKVFRIEDLDDANILLQIGLLCAIETVEQVVHKLCRQRIRIDPPQSGKAPSLSTINTSWEFDNLFGAMYLQMWWLIGSRGIITRCEFCGRPVSLARTYPDGRKRRRDKRFCDDACRQAHHRAKKES
jgi:hypothetical protein